MSSVFSKIAMLCTLSNPVAFEGSQFDIATREFWELLNDSNELEAFIDASSAQYRAYKAKSKSYGVSTYGARHWFDTLAPLAEKEMIMWTYIQKYQFELDDMLADRIHAIIYNGVDRSIGHAENMDVVNDNMNNITSTFYREYLEIIYDADLKLFSATSHIYYDIAIEMLNLKIMINALNAIDVSKPMDQWPDEEGIHNILMDVTIPSFMSFNKLKGITVGRFYSKVKDIQYHIDV